MTDYNPPPPEGYPDNREQFWASPPPGSPPPASPPPGSWAPQPGMPQAPPPGTPELQSAQPPPAAANPPFPTEPPPGAKARNSPFRRMLIIGSILIAAVIGLGVIAGLGSGSTSTAFIDIGECFADFSQFEASVEGETQLISSVDGADCDEPHALETYYIGDAFEGMGGEFDQALVDEVAIETCETEFETYVNFEWETSELDYWWLTPSPQGWDADDRELICLVGDYNRGMTVGTLRNTGR